MPNIFQCMLTLRNNNGESTSEDYYTNAFTNHKAAMTEFNVLVGKRQALLGKGIRIYSAKVSDVAIKRDAYVSYFSPANGNNPSTWLKAAMFSDVLYNRLYLRMYAGGFHQWGGKFLAGIPDDVCTELGNMDQVRNNIPAWGTALADFMTYLAPDAGGSKWGLYGVEQPVPALPVFDIISVTVNNDLTITLTTSSPHGFVADDRVKLFGGILTPWLRNGYKKVIDVPGASDFKIRKALVPGPAAIDQPGMVVRARPVLTPWTNITPVRFSSRIGARPSDMRPGRRRVRRLTPAA